MEKNMCIGAAVCYESLMEPLVSIIIPVYNDCLYLRKCLNSVIAQTYDNLEIIVIDDGSTDGSGTICEEYVDLNVTVYHTENNGLSAARNFGLDHMNPKAEFVAFLDSDDWMEPNAIQKLCSSAVENKADMVCCSYFHERPSGVKLAYSLDQRVILEGDEILDYYISNGQGMGQEAWNKLYRSDLFAFVRYPVGKVFEDVATTYKLVTRAKKLIIIPTPLFHHRIRDNGISRSLSMECLIDYWDAYYGKYKNMSEIIPESTSYNPMIGDCISAINRLLRGYGGWSKEEQRRANITIECMKHFVKKHKHTVMSSRDYTLLQKITCLCINLKNPCVFLFLNKLNMLYRLLGRKTRYL